MFAWLSTVRISLFVNAFRESGICPLNPCVIDESKLASSMPYSSSEVVAPLPKLSTAGKKVTELEYMIKPETVKLYEERFEEGYDVENDELYSIWSRMKKLTISDPQQIARTKKLLQARNKKEFQEHSRRYLVL